MYRFKKQSGRKIPVYWIEDLNIDKISPKLYHIDTIVKTNVNKCNNFRNQTIIKVFHRYFF